MHTSRRVFLFLSSILMVLAVAQPAETQCVSLTTLGSASTQNFNGLASTGTSITWTDNSTIPGWYATRTTYTVGTGASNSGQLYSFGVAGVNSVTERALGGVASGTSGTFYWAGCFTNDTGTALTSVDIVYIGEQWRDGLGSGAPAAHTTTVEYQVAAPGVITDANTPSTGWNFANALNFTSPILGTVAGALDGNASANRTVKAAAITVGVPVGNQFWIRWVDIDNTGADHGLAADDFSITPQGGANATIVATCPATLTTTAGTATSSGVSAADPDGTVTSASIFSITPADPGTITLTGFTAAGGVGGTANATLDVSSTTPAGSYSVTIRWQNNDGTPQTADCVVAVTVNVPPTVAFIHDVQGTGSASPLAGTTVTVEGVVTGDFQPVANDSRLSGFFLQEETADTDVDPATSEGLFIFCSACPTDVAEGQRVQVTGSVSEFNSHTQITATTAGSVIITNAGNNLAQITAATIDLPIVTPIINDFYEPMESMLVSYSDTLTVSEYFEQARYGRIELYEGGRTRQYTEANPPSVAGYAAQLDNLDRRRVYLDDDDNAQNSPLLLPDGSQFVYHPRANGGLSVGTQGTDFFRGGDLVAGLTGILHYSFSGGTSPNEWRIRPTAATPAAFTPENPRPATPPVVGGTIKAASVNVLNYFTTLNARGADSNAELIRQRERTSIVLCGLNADVVALMEIENGTAAIADLLGEVNTRCGGSTPYAFVNTGGSLGTDQIRVVIIYRQGVLTTVGSPLADMDAVHNRPPTAQTFDVTDVMNPAFGKRFSVIATHFKSKSCSGATGGDLDQNDGQGCFTATRLAQANRLLTWVNGTVIPAAADDPDVLLLGDFNSYAQETATTTLTGGGYTDLQSALLGASAYSYLFDGQLGHLDYAFSSTSLTPQVTGVGIWHINADENPLFDYNDEIDDGAAEASFEEKPDGSSLVPPRVLFQPASPYRASDHDPVLTGLFPIPTAPGAPTIGSATPGDGEASITFTPPANDGGSPITSYTVTCSPSGSASGSGSPITVTGLTNGTAYTCSVTATNAFGTSAPSGDVTVTPSGALPVAQSLMVDAAGNGVLEAGESVMLEPSWMNPAASPLSLSGVLTSFTGPSGPTYNIETSVASYGTIQSGATAACSSCYAVSIVAPNRPVVHWDATATESLSTFNDKAWSVHVGNSFTDVATSYLFYRQIETLLHNNVTLGCGDGTQYCKDNTTPRISMAVFIARAELGSDAAVPASGIVGASSYNCSVGGNSLYTDVAASNQFCKHVHYIASQNITSGCTATTFCPSQNVTRIQMAIFLARALAGSDGAVPVSYTDPVTLRSYNLPNNSRAFTDLVNNTFEKHANYIWARGITDGCTGTTFCPSNLLTRGQMAKFLVGTYNMLLYKP